MKKIIILKLSDELYICFKDIMNINDIDTSDIFSLFKYNDFYTFNSFCFIGLFICCL